MMPSQCTRAGTKTRGGDVFRECISQVWLTPRLSYNVDLEAMTVRIASVGELSIMGYPRNLKEYAKWRMRESRLVVRDGKAYLKLFSRKRMLSLRLSLILTRLR